MNKSKKLWIVAGAVLAIVMAFSISVAVFYAVLMSLNDGTAYYRSLSMDDIYIPEDMDKDNLGLFWMDTAGERHRYDEDDVPFDPSKPIIMYIHGWGGGANINNPQKWLQMGYNVGIMRWGDMSTISPFDAQSKLWGINESLFWWERNDGKWEFEDVPSHCVAQILTACYSDFMKKHGFYGSEIRFMGHSLGAQACLAMSNYMLSAIDKGEFCADFLPDRITMLDPYLSDLEDETEVSWLDGVSMVDGGSTKLAYLTVKALYERGIAIDGVRTSVVKVFADVLQTGYYPKMEPYVIWTDVTSDFYPENYNFTNLMDMALKHEYAFVWAADMLGQGLVKDYTYQDSAYAWSPFLPSSYAYARAGVVYDMPTNLVQDDMSDDYQYSQNITKAKIAGFAFWDANLNGVKDERVTFRIDGVKVALYQYGNPSPIAQTVTSAGGYYQFLLEESFFGKSYYIKTELPKGCKITQIPSQPIQERYLMGCNNINKELLSQTVEITDAGALHIINLGFTKSLNNILKG